MKKLISTGAALLLACAWAFASQPPVSSEGHFYIGLQAGPMLNLYENTFSYKDNGKTLDLITFQGGIVTGYDFNEIFGLRLSASYAKNASACNVRQTSGGGFYPFTFSSFNVFADAVLNLTGLAKRVSPFSVSLYGGLGLGHTFHMSDAHHPWQVPNDPNTAFGFRFGGVAEYSFSPHFGIFADLCGEAYTDNYNGLKPTREEQADYEGYGGFPLDLRGLVSFGLKYRF